VANPPVYENSYKWFIDAKEVPGQHGFYYEIFNVTREYHDKQVRCSVENNLGVAMGLKSIEVKCELFPRFFANLSTLRCFSCTCRWSDIPLSSTNDVRRSIGGHHPSLHCRQQPTAPLLLDQRLFSRGE
jgi:hypothetical protein